MPNFFFAEEELKYAKEALNTFLTDKNFTPTSRHWADFVVHLDLAFIKAERGCQDIKNTFLPFQGYYVRQRKKDPLLSYLKNSRDAVMHGTTVLVDLEIVSRQIVDYFELESVDKDGNRKKETHPMFPARIKLKQFKSQGRTYDPPKIHLGKSLVSDREPFEAGFLGIKFYTDFIVEAKKRFIK